jgi:LPS export ABC transporter protein LptC
MSWRWISISALLGALVLGYGALTGRDTLSFTAAQAPPQPGYHLRDAVISQTREDGSPGLRLVASRIEQNSDRSGIQAHDVRVDYLNAPDQRWLLTAREGFVPDQSRIVQFNGNVELRPVDGNDGAVLRTEALEIDMARNVAYSTSSPVQITMGANTLTVKRFEADLNTEKVKLESARGRIQPR